MPAGGAELRLSAQIAPVVALCVVCKSMLFSARTCCGADRPRSGPARVLPLVSKQLGALPKFLLNPLFGKLSDTYGRKAILHLGPLFLAVCHSIMFLRPWGYVAARTRTACYNTSCDVFFHHVAHRFLMCLKAQPLLAHRPRSV